MLKFVRKSAHRRYLFNGGKSRQHKAGWAREGVSVVAKAGTQLQIGKPKSTDWESTQFERYRDESYSKIRKDYECEWNEQSSSLQSTKGLYSRLL